MLPRVLVGRSYWSRAALMLVIAVTLSVATRSRWPLIVWCILLVVLLVVTYGATTSAIDAAAPAGSVATTEFLDDRVISRNSGSVREVRYDDIASVTVREDMVLMRLHSASATLVLSRALFGHDPLEELRPRSELPRVTAQYQRPHRRVA